MKHHIKYLNSWFIAVALILTVLQACRKDEPPRVPVLSATVLAQVKQNSVVCFASISSDAGFPVTSSGFCWSTEKNPTLNQQKVESGIKSGLFTCPISGLIQNTTYYIRAYAINSEGTAYGDELRFTTLPVELPYLLTLAPNQSTLTTGICGGNVELDGGAPVIERGVCWSTTENPTVNSAGKTSDGSGKGVYKSVIKGLVLGQTYYVRAYATNIAGTAYGKQKAFVFDTVHASDADGNVYNTVTIGSQTWLKENLKTTRYQDGSLVPNIVNSSWGVQTAGAYCWYNNDTRNKDIYGALYNFYTVQDSSGLCPTGWHIPSKAEWDKLIEYVGGAEVAGVKLMEAGPVHWKPYNKATNETGFTALPGGDRWTTDFFYLEFKGSWWTATEFDAWKAYCSAMASSYQDVRMYESEKFVGLSVRCVKD